MIIEAKNLSTFLKLISDRISADKDKVSIFFSEKPAYPSVTIGGFPSEKDHMEFVYLLLSPTYQAVYQDYVKKQEYVDIKKQLDNFFEKNAAKLKIMVFDSIAVDSSKNTILVSTN